MARGALGCGAPEDMSTVSLETSDELAATKARGVGFVDVTMKRLASHADRGECLFKIGGSVTDSERVKPLLDGMGSTIFHCGPAGPGTRMKLVNDYLAVTSCQLDAEAWALSQRFGLDLERTLDVLYGTTTANGQGAHAGPGSHARGFLRRLLTRVRHKDFSAMVDVPCDFVGIEEPRLKA